jgi:hypothetical protein
MAESVTTPRDGMSRRDMIRASAIAGAAAWTAPVIIDSLSSPAAAGSVQCTVCVSAVYVFYEYNDVVYYAAFQNGQPGPPMCAQCKSGTINQCLSCPTGGPSYSLYGGAVGGSNCASTTVEHNLYYTAASTCPGDPTTMTPVLGEGANCNARVTLSSDGSTISPGSGVTILGAFYFTAANWHGVCPAGGVIDISSVCSDPCNP